MVQIRLQPPDPFNFKTPDDWPRWRRRFEQFRVASGLTEDAQTRQISTHLYCLGEEAEAVLTSTNATEEERRTYDTVIEKFNGFFKIRNNVIFERARFNRSQIDGETADEYIMVLYRLSENCEYGAMTSEMIRDRLVVGIRNAPLSEHLQLDPKLTLETVKKMVRQREAVEEQQHILKRVESKMGASLEEMQPSRENFVKNRKKTRGETFKPKVTTHPRKSCSR